MRAGAARGTGRNGKIAQRHQQPLSFDVFEADVKVVRQPLGHGSVHAHAVEIAAQAVEESIAHRAQADTFGGHLLLADLCGLSETDDPGHVQRSRTETALLSTPFELTRQLEARLLPPDEERA